MESSGLFLPRLCTGVSLNAKKALRNLSLSLVASLENKLQHEERLELIHFAMASIMTLNYSARAVRIFQATFAIVILGLSLYCL